ncbi:MAG TPA: tetratricopeptide repeat protein [Candidatus Eisenbacteria bacterium]|nr:tetratricopeptide repeat protein [Candidatus Eisenbacteria bacterium]
MAAPDVGVEPGFGELLSAYRAAAGLTQEELAARANLSADAVSLLERSGRSSPRSSTVRALSDALGLGRRERDVFAAAARRRRRPLALRVPPDLRLPATPFVGRERELAQVRALLARADVRLLTLTGSPGAGKTRLALEAAAVLASNYRDGAVVATLGPLTGPELVMPAIQRSLGLPEAATEPSLQTVVAYCRVRQLLLVLDNLERLLPVGPELSELLAGCPGLQILATSRAALRVRAERELPVPPLRLPTTDEERAREPAALLGAPAVRLFLDRVEAAVPDFRLTTANTAAVAAICRRLDGLPLALELAAPWIRLLPPAELLARLDHRLDLLVDGPQDLPERQRTMRGALRWSYELLDPGPQALLRRLSVFAGSAPVDALELVGQAASPLGDVLQHLAALADHSLVLPLSADGHEARVTMLESVREYARELLARTGELEATAQAHLEHCTDLAVAARREIKGPGQAAWLDRLRREHDNLRTTMGWAAESGRTETGLRLAAALSAFWDFAGHRREGLSNLERLLAAGGDVEPAVRAEALHVAASLAWRVGEHELAVARQRESLALFRELRDPRGVANAMRGLGIALDMTGGHGESLRLFEEAVSLLRELDDRELLASALLNLGVGQARHGDPRRAAALYEEALALYREMGNALSIAHCLVNLGNRAKSDGMVALAAARYEEAASIARRLDSPFHLAAALIGLGDIARICGETAAAGARYRESLRLFARPEERQGIAVCLRMLGWVAWREGRPDAAARLYGAGDALWPDAAAADKDEEQLHTRAVAGLREQLGEERFVALHQAGGRLSLDEAVAAGLAAS